MKPAKCCEWNVRRFYYIQKILRELLMIKYQKQYRGSWRDSIHKLMSTIYYTYYMMYFFFLCRRKNKELYLSRILLSYSYDRIEQVFFINILKVLASYHHLNNNNNNRSHPNCRIIRKYDSVILINVIMRRNFVIHTSGRD